MVPGIFLPAFAAGAPVCREVMVGIYGQRGRKAQYRASQFDAVLMLPIVPVWSYNMALSGDPSIYCWIVFFPSQPMALAWANWMMDRRRRPLGLRGVAYKAPFNVPQADQILDR